MCPPVLALLPLLAPTVGDSPKVAFLVAEDEYQAARTLPAFARRELAQRHGFELAWILDGDAPGTLRGLEHLENADLLVLFARRRSFDGPTLAAVRAYLDSGRPVVGLRTASHAFQNWLAFDPEVLGGHYEGHHGNQEATQVRVLPSAAGHPIVAGLPAREFASSGSLYKVRPLAPDTTPLLEGRVEGRDDRQPVAWTRARDGGQRVFYTSLGHPEDFEGDAFNRLLVQGVFWAMDLPAPTVPTLVPRPPDPVDAAAGFDLAPGFTVEVAAAEPTIVQPVEVQFDARGRMWVVQYIQYMYPAGLRPTAADEYDRRRYDRVPAPPPDGPRGADRITILEDRDGVGRWETARDFVDGLNLATSVAFGDGGVYVAQTPYLLFYPDADGDDLPDGPPRVVLEGFGMEDAHAVVNSLTWGPDGWLYGAQGSTCTARVRGHVFQQAAWRYHPESDRFEVFAEGGGNTFGLEFDPGGELLTGTNWGEFVLVHYVQGGYYFKNFGKHGPLSNPYSFGHYPHAPHEGEAQGHVAQVGLVYQGDAWPERARGAWVMPHLLGHRVCLHEVAPLGSSFRTRHLECLLRTDDRWFRPVDVVQGPDGALYVADWCDTRATHLIPEDTWDKTSGRVYRVAASRAPRAPARDLRVLSSAELVELLDDPNVWQRRQALRLLDFRGDSSVHAALRARLWGERGRALWGLWALHVSGGLDVGLAARVLAESPLEDLRAWTVRLLGDDARWPRVVAEAALGRIDGPRYARQLASTARRLSPDQRVEVLAALLGTVDHWPDDPHLGLMTWWLAESLAAERPEQLVDLRTETASKWAQRELWPRLARRLVLEESARADQALARLLATPDDRPLLGSVLDELRDSPRRVAALEVIEAIRGWQVDPGVREALALLGDDEQVERLLVSEFEDLVFFPGDFDERVVRLAALAPQRYWEVFTGLLATAAEGEHLDALLQALAGFEDLRVGEQILSHLPTWSAETRSVAFEVLSRRAGWSNLVLSELEAGRLEPRGLRSEIVARLRLHSEGHARRTAAIWGDAERSDQARRASLARARGLVVGGGGEAARGEALFAEHCGRCHRLFDTGEDIGPDLTGYDRDDLDFLLLSIADPGAAIREGYEDWIVRTTDGLIVSGFLVAQGPRGVTLEDAQRVRTTIPRGEIEELVEATAPRMPAGLLDALTDEQVRDLFAFLRR